MSWTESSGAAAEIDDYVRGPQPFEEKQAQFDLPDQIEVSLTDRLVGRQIHRAGFVDTLVKIGQPAHAREHLLQARSHDGRQHVLYRARHR